MFLLSVFGEMAATYDSAVISVARRIAASPSLSDVSQRICSLPPRQGGLGLRTWGSTADNAFLAAYTHASHYFPILFPDRPYLSNMTPDPRSLYYINQIHHHSTALSTWSGWAARALARTHAKAPGVLEALAPIPGSTSRSFQHLLSILSDDADSLGVVHSLQIIDDPNYPWRGARYLSACGDSFSFNTLPSDSSTTFENSDFETALKRRLLTEIYTKNDGETLVCPRCKVTTESGNIGRSHTPELDLFGNHAVRCPSASGGPKAHLWHDPLVQQWTRIARFAGERANDEVRNMVLANSGLRADMVIHSKPSILTDIRTSNSTDKKLCKKAARAKGTAAEAGATTKNDKWKDLVQAQGDIFIALVHEDGGRMGEPALDLINQLSHRFGSSKTERATLTNYALQRLHTTSQRGVAALCRNLRPLPLGPALLSPGVSVHSLGVPPRRPAGLALQRDISTVLPMPWQLTAAVRLVPARVTTNGTALEAPVAALNLPPHAPIIALAIAQRPQNLEPAA